MVHIISQNTIRNTFAKGFGVQERLRCKLWRLKSVFGKGFSGSRGRNREVPPRKRIRSSEFLNLLFK